MIRSIATALFVCVCSFATAFAQTSTSSRNVVIVTDVLPAAAALAETLKATENIDSAIVTQGQLPANLSSYRAVIVHVEGRLDVDAAGALQDYTKAGGRLVLLHNSIGPNKSSTPEWMPYVGVKLISGDAAKGGFRSIPNASVDLVELTLRNFVTENKIIYTKAVTYKSASRARAMALPALSFPGTEVFVNHAYTRPKRLLMGIKVTDPRSGVTYMQDSGIWVEELDNGQIYYFMLGQTAADLKVKAYVQMIANAVIAP